MLMMIDKELASKFREDLRRLRAAGVKVEHEMAPRLGIHRVQLYRYMRPDDQVLRCAWPTPATIERCRPELDRMLTENGLA